MELSAERMEQGGTVAAAFTGMVGETAPTVETDLGNVQAVRLGSGWRAYIPAAYNAAAGAHEVTFTVGGETVVKNITVIPKDFGTVEIEAEPEASEAANTEFRNAVWPLYEQPAREKLWSGGFACPAENYMTLVDFGQTKVTGGKQGSKSNSTKLYTIPGDPCRAPANGVVVLARNLALTGNTVVIDHGCGLRSYLYGLDALSVSEGQSVERGHVLDGTAGYFYGALAPSTGYIDRFCIEPYYKGFYLALPLRTNPGVLNKNVQQEKMFGIFQEYQSWVRIMGVPTVGDVNSKVLAGDAGGMIKLAEAFHERKFAWVADTIYDANLSRGVRIVLISGPSSSGKTTSAKRLGIQLGVLGLKPVLISLDDYFVDREKTPKDADGEYDYEALEAIDLELFNDHLRRLMRGESVDIPRYNFITGRRMQHNDPLTLDERSILIVEGIHGLNPRLTPGVPEEQKFRIYISCFTSVFFYQPM